MLASSGAAFALSPCMAERSLEERVSAIEAQLGNKTLEQHFREQAETKFDAKLEPLKRDLTVIKHAVNVILTRLP